MTTQNTVKIKIVIFSILNNSLRIFLIGNKLPKCTYQPDDFENQVEKLFQAITKMELNNNYKEQLYTVSSSKNIEIVYYVLLPTESAKKIYFHFFPIDNIKEKNESNILEYALQRLRWKIEYTNVIYSLLPDNFTLSELQKGYEIILGRSLDKRNFRKKMLSLDFLVPTERRTLGPTRPAQLYRFKEKQPKIIKIFS